jgi:hypothetical protein
MNKYRCLSMFLRSVKVGAGKNKKELGVLVIREQD